MSDEKRIILKSIIGFIMGIVVGLLITAIAFMFGENKEIVIVSPEFAQSIGNTALAFVIQSVLTGMLGVAGYGGSELYRIESWSLLRSTLTHFIIVISLFFVIAFTLKWIVISDIPAMLIMLGSYVAVYFIIWLVSYLKVNHQVRDINTGLEKMKDHNSRS